MYLSATSLKRNFKCLWLPLTPTHVFWGNLFSLLLSTIASRYSLLMSSDLGKTVLARPQPILIYIKYKPNILLYG